MACATPTCTRRGPYSRDLGLCRTCGLRRKKIGGRAGGRTGSRRAKSEAGRAGGHAGSHEDKIAAGRAGSHEDKATAGRAGPRKCKAAAGRRSGHRRKAEMALVIKGHWLDKILAGKKTWEIRSSATCRRGWIHLAKSGSKELCGGANLVGCRKISRRNFTKFKKQHCVPSLSNVPYKTIWAWILEDAVAYTTNFDYVHTQGAVIFVRTRQPMGRRPNNA